MPNTSFLTGELGNNTLLASRATAKIPEIARIWPVGREFFEDFSEVVNFGSKSTLITLSFPVKTHE